MDRYQELKKENNQSIIYLGDQYKNFTRTLIKKVRSFAAKSIQTEILLKETIDKIKEYDEKRININVVIPNPDEFIKEELQKYSKRYIDHDYRKGLIVLIILIIVSSAIITFQMIASRKPTFNSPSNFNYEIIGSEVILRWDPVELASGYSIYYVTKDGHKSSTYDVYDSNNIRFNIEKDTSYTFYIFVKETDYIKQSKEVSLLVIT